MYKKKTVLMIAAAIALTALASCGTPTPAATSAPETTAAVQTTEQTTTAAETTTTTAAESEAEAQPADEQSDRTDIPESEWDEYQEKIFAANQRPAVFKNHQFMIMEVDFGIDPGEYKAYYNWFTENVTYYRAPAYEEFSSPDVRYELVGIGSDWNPVATYYLDMIEGGYQFWPVPDDLNVWCDPENETITEMYIQDGKLCMTSVYTEAGTENYYSILLPQVEYTGGTLKYTAVFDAESLEFSESSSYIEKDGKTEWLFTDTYKYDEPVPSCINAIEGFFERGNVSAAVTVTATVNPGTEKELTKSVTIPANSAVDFYTPDI